MIKKISDWYKGISGQLQSVVNHAVGGVGFMCAGYMILSIFLFIKLTIAGIIIGGAIGYFRYQASNAN